MPSRQHISYVLASALLGVAWCLVLSLVPSGVTMFLTVPEWWNYGLTWAEHLVLLCTTSVALALLFQRFIVTARTWPARLLRAFVLPLVGMLFYVGLFVPYAALTRPVGLGN